MTTMTEAECRAEITRLNKLAKKRPGDQVWTERCKLAAKQTRNLFNAEIAGDRDAANNLRGFLKDNLEWINAHGA